MAAFSLAALAAAFVLVQYLHANRMAPGSATVPAEPPAPIAPAQGESGGAPIPSPAPAPDLEAQDRSELLRADLERVRGDLKAAFARISELEDAVRELQAAPAHNPQPEPEAPAISRMEPSARLGAEPAAQLSRGDGKGASTHDAAEVKGEHVATSYGEKMRYVVQSGDTAGKIAKTHCLPLADLGRLNPHVQDLNALGVSQALALEDRCIRKSKERAVAH